MNDRPGQVFQHIPGCGSKGVPILWEKSLLNLKIPGAADNGIVYFLPKFQSAEIHDGVVFFDQPQRDI